MRQKHLCRVFQTQNLKGLSHLWLIMTWNGRAPGTSARTTSSDCWGKWTSLVQVACRSLSSMSSSTWRPDSWHERSSSPLRHFVFILVESSEKPRSFGGGHFRGWPAGSPMCRLWDEGLGFGTCGQRFRGCLQRGGAGTGATQHLGLERVGAEGPLSLGLLPSVADVVGVGASTNMGIALHHVWMEGLGGDSSTQTQWKVHRNRKRYVFLMQMYVPFSSLQLWNTGKSEKFWV